MGNTTDSHTEGKTFNLTDYEIAMSRTNNIVYYSFLVPIAVLGNIFTLTAVFMVLRMKKSIPNMLIGVLAFADLTSVLTCHLISIISMVSGQLIGGKDICHFQSIMAYTYFKLGFFSKTCISIDRFIALKYPLKYRSIVTTKKVVGIIIFNILFSIGSSIVTGLIDGEYIIELETWHMCTQDFSQFTEYKLTIVILEGSMFFIGVIIFMVGNVTVVRVMLDLSSKLKKIKETNSTIRKLTTVTTTSVGFTNIAQLSQNERSTSGHDINKYNDELNTPLSKRALGKAKLYTADKNTPGKYLSASNGQISSPSLNDNDGQQEYVKRNKTRKESQRYSNPGSPMNGQAKLEKDRKKSIFKKVKELPGKALAKKKENRQKKELQFAKLVMVIVTVFVILWIPYMFTIYYEHSNEERLHPFIIDISMKLVFANACINPILYGLFNANFRRAYVYYIRMFGFYATCKTHEKPDGKEMPWSLALPTPPTNPSHITSQRTTNTM